MAGFESDFFHFHSPELQVAGSRQLDHLTNRFYVTVRLFSNRSQMTSKFGKNKKVWWCDWRSRLLAKLARKGYFIIRAILKLDKDLLVLQRALRNEVPKWDPEEGDWQLPKIIGQFHHTKVAPYLAVKRLVDGPFVPQYQAGLNQSGGSSFPWIRDLSHILLVRCFDFVD